MDGRMFNSRSSRLNPSLWRTCRALANRNRLRLLQYLIVHPDENVSRVAEHVGLRVSLASQYLRALNARGILAVSRRGVWVHYRVAPDPTIPEAALLVNALRRELNGAGPSIEHAFSALTAFTHPRRIRLVRLLGETGHLGRDELRRRSDMSGDALSRHLAKLTRRGIVSEEDGVWRLGSPGGPLAKALVAIAVQKGR